MALKFYYNSRITKNEMHIGKNGQLRIKAHAMQEFSIEKGQRWMIATDAQEKTIKHIYLIRDGEKGGKGYKVSGNSVNGYHMNIKGAIQEMGITIPARCTYEPFEIEEYSCIKLTLI